MKLTITNSPGTLTTNWYNEAFAIICDQLGISQVDEEVQLTFRPGYDAGTAQKWNPGEPLRVRVGMLVALNTDGRRESFAHEMVHVSQMVAGRLRQADGYQWWEGKRFMSNKDVHTVMWASNRLRGAGIPRLYADVFPWEKEAYPKGVSLAQELKESGL